VRSGEAGVVTSELRFSRKDCFPSISSIRRKAVTAVHPECIFPSASSANLDKWESTSWNVWLRISGMDKAGLFFIAFWRYWSGDARVGEGHDRIRR
jgi:hypothetical protein